ncbi:MAG: YbhB/YbcL family Raf kinase inhibitor-like protein [Epsilonproteobacteria bacterium]|nr:YbhB/YbcL family Raf kinase inhibitor-like protein [Campylobacterota bacterium]NPA63638.1 YbhB/YbcL family Raf kinase inhibitor-like protein [Campylobacterota bacterium]
MRLLSPAFENGGMIPSQYTCDGADKSVPLIFHNVPSEAKSLALVMDDPDAPMGVFVHWVIYDIPSALQGLPEGVPHVPELEYGIKQGFNDFGKIGYGGPCPPKGAHRYFFKLYALSADLALDPGLTKAQLLQLIAPYVIEEAVLMGIYERQVIH